MRRVPVRESLVKSGWLCSNIGYHRIVSSSWLAVLTWAECGVLNPNSVASCNTTQMSCQQHYMLGAQHLARPGVNLHTTHTEMHAGCGMATDSASAIARAPATSVC